MYMYLVPWHINIAIYCGFPCLLSLQMPPKPRKVAPRRSTRATRPPAKLSDTKAAAPRGRNAVEPPRETEYSVSSDGSVEVNPPRGRPPKPRARTARRDDASTSSERSHDPDSSPSTPKRRKVPTKVYRSRSHYASDLASSEDESPPAPRERSRHAHKHQRRAKSRRGRSTHKSRRKSRGHKRRRSNNSDSARSSSSSSSSASEFSSSDDAAELKRKLHRQARHEREHGPVPQEGLTEHLGVSVKKSIRKKIHKNKFVNLIKLLPQMRSKHPHKAAPREILNIDAWSDAFLIYAAIYLEKYPEEARGMLKYASVIRGIARQSRGLGWKQYDENFRKSREANVHKYAWVSTNWGLLYNFGIMSVSAAYANPGQANCGDSFRGDGQNSGRSQSGSRTEGIPRSFCFSYHGKGARCKAGAGCKYKHTCPKCQAAHSLFHCDSSGQPGSGADSSDGPMAL